MGGLGAVVGLGLAPGKVGVVVRLVDCDDSLCRVDDGTLPAAPPEEPVVETGAADEERRHRVEEGRREDEEVERRGAAKNTFLDGATT